MLYMSTGAKSIGDSRKRLVPSRDDVERDMPTTDEFWLQWYYFYDDALILDTLAGLQ
jgi:hypothetical protein